MTQRDKLAGQGRANRRRGEVEAVINGERRILCLTLGALSELETAFGVSDLGALAAHLSAGRLRSGDLVKVMGAGLRGGGNLFADEDLADAYVEGGVAACAALVGDLLELAFGTPLPARPPETAAGPQPRGGPCESPAGETAASP
ncbi:gene transfer agent family protein [Rhizobium sp. SSA_523]|uniref:gene transfer agent family protein n=1 Tax=Rhizobium sp. SSA_523 TaxID=2952477 RepID=UPI0020915CC2|nr:gene transfer agent family protein [Rhizobium sp. SSA_523]MCO5730904.1 gene transfer agent family protein [Rhizobium sp. SSA_523]WKC24283.1 gene transfer agent family protein [Rhizobium sp. SSA_523]